MLMNMIGQLRPAIGQLDLWFRDTYDQLLGKRQPMIPPRRLMYDGPQDNGTFIQNGEEFFRYYRELCGLQPSEFVVDIGSGMGRKAVPLTSYLTAEGRYQGFDINPIGVEWCQNEITSRYPHFHFAHIDVFNGRYNPTGARPASEYTFPVADGSADLVVLGSVFTHMFRDDVDRYLAEISRMLDITKGRCLISYFVLNDEVRRHIEAGQSSLSFAHQQPDGCYIERPAQPEDAVAFEQENVERLYAQNGLGINKIHWGSWCGRGDYLSYQDLILASRADFATDVTADVIVDIETP